VSGFRTLPGCCSPCVKTLTFAIPINVVKPLLAAKGRVALPFPPASPPSP
jgi:hypothetical protein